MQAVIFKLAIFAVVAIVVGAALLYITLSPVVSMDSLYNRVLFHPSHNMTRIPSMAGLPVEDIYFRKPDGTRLHGWYVHNPKAAKTILFSHGNGGCLPYHAGTIEASVRAGASVFAYDYQGFGNSEGKPSLDGVVSDAEAAYEFVITQKKVLPQDIVLVGQSLGTGVAAELAKRKPCSALILISPYTNIINVAREHLPWLSLYPRFCFPPQILDTQQNLASAHPKTYVIHGELDRTIPVHHSRDLQIACAQPLQVKILPKVGHDVLGEAPAEAMNMLREALYN